MDNLFYTLLSTLVTRIGAHANIDASKVALGRQNPLSESELPFINVFLEEDTSIGDFGPTNTNFMDWSVQVGIEIYVSGTAGTSSLDQTFLNIRADIHNALMADITQGLNFVKQTIPLGASSPVIDTNELKTAAYRTAWGFHIRTSIDDMTVV